MLCPACAAACAACVCSVMLVEAQMLRLSAPLLQPVGHQVPLGPHHISLPILLQQVRGLLTVTSLAGQAGKCCCST